MRFVKSKHERNKGSSLFGGFRRFLNVLLDELVKRHKARDEKYFDEYLDLLPENPDRAVLLARKKNAVLIDDWLSDYIYVLVFESEKEADEAVERASKIAESFDNVDFPTENFIYFYEPIARKVEKIEK